MVEVNHSCKCDLPPELIFPFGGVSRLEPSGWVPGIREIGLKIVKV